MSEEIFRIETKPAPSDVRYTQFVLVGVGVLVFVFTVLFPILSGMKSTLVICMGIGVVALEITAAFFWPRFMLAQDKSGHSYHFFEDELVIKNRGKEIRRLSYENIRGVSEYPYLSQADKDQSLSAVMLHLEHNMLVPFVPRPYLTRILLKGVADPQALVRIKEVVEKNKRA